MVAVITGSVALEAAILGKPALTFGDCPYNLLPETMVRRVDDVRHLPGTIADLLRHYQSDERALESYVAAVYATSASVNLYSVLLKKKSVHVERESSYREEIERLARYAVQCARSPEMPADSLDEKAARW